MQRAIRLTLPLLLLLLGACAPAQTLPNFQRGAAEQYDLGAFLSRVESRLPKWEALIKDINPAAGNATYQQSQALETTQALGLEQVQRLRRVIERLKQKRTVADELSLWDKLQEMSANLERLSNLVHSEERSRQLGKANNELGVMLIPFATHVQLAVEGLESQCATLQQ